MSTLAELFPAGGGKQANFTASGSIDAGAPVTLNADGTISEISSSSESASYPLGSTATLVSNGDNVKMACTYADPFNHNRWVMTWNERASSTTYHYARFITRSGNSLTLGTKRTIPIASDSSRSDTLAGASVCWCTHTPNKFLFGADSTTVGGLRGSAVVITVSDSGTNPTISAEGDWHRFSDTQFAGDGQNVPSPFQPLGNTGKYIVGLSPNSRLNACILTVTGDTITSGTEVEIIDRGVASGNHSNLTINPWDPTKGCGVIIPSSGNSWYLQDFTIDGTTITPGTERQLYDDSGDEYKNRPTLAYCDETRVILCVADQAGNGSPYYAIVHDPEAHQDDYDGSSEYAWTPGPSGSPKPEYQAMISNSPNTPLTFVGAWITGSAGYPYCRSMTVSSVANGTISLGTDTQMDNTNTSQSNQAILGVSQSHGAGGYFLVSWHDDDDVYVRLGKTGGVFGNYKDMMTGVGGHIGIADSAISDGASGSVTVKGGIYTSLSSLTIGADYYLQENGTIGTTSTSFKLGRALSATTIDLEYQS